MKTYILEFDKLPPTLNQFPRHWAAKRDLKENWRQIVFATLYQLNAQRPFGKIKLDITFWKPRGRKTDHSNLMTGIDKLILDNLVKLGYLKDDSPKFVEWGKIEEKVGKAKLEMKITVK